MQSMVDGITSRLICRAASGHDRVFLCSPKKLTEEAWKGLGLRTLNPKPSVGFRRSGPLSRRPKARCPW